MAGTLKDPTVIVSGARTPMGSFNGVFADVTAPDLGASAIREALRRSASPMALAPRSGAVTSANTPWNEPIGVRAAETMTVGSFSVPAMIPRQHSN